MKDFWYSARSVIWDISMLPLGFSLLLLGGDFSGLMEWWHKNKGHHQIQSLADKFGIYCTREHKCQIATEPCNGFPRP